MLGSMALQRMDNVSINVEDLVTKMQQHYQRPARIQPVGPVGYAAQDMATVFGEKSGGCSGE